MHESDVGTGLGLSAFEILYENWKLLGCYEGRGDMVKGRTRVRSAREIKGERRPGYGLDAMRE